MIPRPPQITPEPLWRRAYLEAGAAYWYARCLIRTCVHSTQTTVTRLVRFRRLVSRDGIPTRRHLDAQGPALSEREKQCLARLDTEITAALPTDLKVALTCGLAPLAQARLAQMTQRRRRS